MIFSGTTVLAIAYNFFSLTGRERFFKPGPVAVMHTGSALHVSSLQQKKFLFPKKRVQ